MQGHKSRADDYGETAHVEAHVLCDDGVFPNNSEVPFLLYHQALDTTGSDVPERILERFAQNRWVGGWVNGIYGFHHYHSTAHEVLGIASGQARVQLGGEEGLIATVTAGDVIVIPAGVAHKNLGADPGFTVVGAYPQGQHPDMCYDKPGERPETDEAIARVPLPTSDPLAGPAGALIRHYTA